ncbi:MAG: polyphosphate kinase 2 family protein [Acidimicrobiia bacterium]|nr:polyphosphate kinase 2 family protein [Acidimicrobiia bacterium]
MINPREFMIRPGSAVSLADHDPSSKRGFTGGKNEGRKALRDFNRSLAELQTRLWAESTQKLLVVIQAIDTGGKDGTIRNVFSGVNPQGVRIHSFGVPTEEELAHDYLWRIHHHTPASGLITVFNRSHYEDVLVVRVRNLVPESRWQKRYNHINEFEKMLTDEGTTIVKLFLHISKEEQKERLQSRIARPDKNWKFRAGDLEDRALWDEYMTAFEAMLSRTSTEYAPWYVVPANRKWYRNLVASKIVIDTLERMDPRFPDPEPGIESLVVE